MIGWVPSWWGVQRCPGSCPGWGGSAGAFGAARGTGAAGLVVEVVAVVTALIIAVR